MRFGLGYLGRAGNSLKKLAAGQTLLRSQGQAIVTFIAPAYTLLAAAGSATVNFIGSTTPAGGGSPALQADFSATSSEWFFFS